MTDIRIFNMDGGGAKELKGSSVNLEKTLQTYIEKNLETLLGITFLESEYTTGKTHGGRIDTLGIDENGFPVIIEYKRTINENVINQGLFYIDWLLDHKGEFELRVIKKLGKEWEEKIDWNNPRLLCIAGDFTKYDVHAVQQINRNIELIRYRLFGGTLLLLELVNATSVQNNNDIKLIDKKIKNTGSKTFSDYLSQSDEDLKNLYESLRLYIETLGDDVQIKVLKHYVAFKRIKNFTCVLIHPQSKVLLLYVWVSPDEVDLDEGFTRDVRNVWHLGTGNLEITLRNNADLDRAKELIFKSYEGN